MRVAGKTIIRNKKAREALLKGILDASDTISSTYGPRGRTVLFDRGGIPRPSKDGLTVAREIKFSNEAKNMGAMLIKEAASKSNYVNGDGSTGTTILTAELCKEAHKLLNQGIDINDLRAGYQLARDYVLQQLAGYKLEITSEDDIYNIAKISANGDEDIASIVKEAFASIGDHGIVSIADSLSRKGVTEIIKSNGFEFDRGFLSSKSVNSTNDQCILTNTKLLISSNVINDVEDLKILFQLVNNEPVVVIAPDFSDEVMAFHLELLSKGNAKGALILAPGVSKTNISDRLSDIAVISDGKVLGQEVSINEFGVGDFGTVDQITINKAKTIITNNIKDSERFEKHMNLLRTKIETDSASIGYSEAEITNIKDRLARMTGGVVTILIGSLTTVELTEKKDRYEDAINAVRASLKDGFVPGASLPLTRISYTYNVIHENASVMTAIRSYLKAIRKPAKLLIASTGLDYEAIIPEIIKDSNGNVGFNAREAKIDNLITLGIIDPYLIIYNSVLYASNIAEQFMSIDTVIISDQDNMTLESLDDILNED